MIGCWLFEPNNEKLWGYDEDHLARMTGTLGARFPPSFLDKCANRGQFFKPDGKLGSSD